MDFSEPENHAVERIEDLCNVASHLSACRTITLEITGSFTFDDPPSRVVMWVSKEGEQKNFRDSFGADLAWGIERGYFSFDRLDEWTGAFTFGPKSQELLNQCARRSE